MLRMPCSLARFRLQHCSGGAQLGLLRCSFPLADRGEGLVLTFSPLRRSLPSEGAAG